MAREAFKEVNFSPESRAKVRLCNSIIRDYLRQGLRLTLRQLYYQLVIRNAIRNVEREYKNLSTLVSNARLAGQMDWDAIEDRVRQPRRPPEFENLGELVDAALSSYRLPRWATQDVYAELWVEKDALAGVLGPLAHDHHVTLMVNRGYSSQSAMYEASKRFIASGKPGVLFYLGDHDPSGEDMVRDIRDRLEMFGADVKVEKVALTMDQVQEYNPPPNPAKMTDPRAGAYVAEHGDESWEVDALPPEVLAGIIRTAFAGVIDEAAMEAIKEREEHDKSRLQSALESLDDQEDA
ncbi:MAG TPA: hypothetical protein VGR23_03655 [Candidatus Dormibacteraeota bacterium]|jgi:hypothetical protein|nr:hypothetical protein [Candidatus Dormibacteraeota bacterium]